MANTTICCHVSDIRPCIPIALNTKALAAAIPNVSITSQLLIGKFLLMIYIKRMKIKKEVLNLKIIEKLISFTRLS